MFKLMQSPYGRQVFLLGGTMEPADGFLKIDRSTPSIAVHQPRMILGFTMALFCGTAKPLQGFFRCLGNPFTTVVKGPQFKLGQVKSI